MELRKLCKEAPATKPLFSDTICVEGTGFWNRQIADGCLGGLHRGTTSSQARASLGQTGISDAAADWSTKPAWVRDVPEQRAH